MQLCNYIFNKENGINVTDVSNSLKLLSSKSRDNYLIRVTSYDLRSTLLKRLRHDLTYFQILFFHCQCL